MKMLIVLSLFFATMYSNAEFHKAFSGRIHSDLIMFQKGFDHREVTKSYNAIISGIFGELDPVMLVQLQSNRLRCKFPATLAEPYQLRAKNMRNNLKYALSRYSFPDCSFIVSLDNCYENPFFLSLISVPILSISKSKRNRKVLLFPPQFLGTINEFHDGQPSVNWDNKTSKVYWQLSTFCSDKFVHIDNRLSPFIPLKTLGLEYPQSFDFHHEHLDKPYFHDYKYLLAFDQRSTPIDFSKMLEAHSCILLAESDYEFWGTSLLKPYVHYVPLDSRCETLCNVLDWCKTHDEDCKQIADNAYELSRHLSKDASLLYFRMLVEEYARLAHGTVTTHK